MSTLTQAVLDPSKPREAFTRVVSGEPRSIPPDDRDRQLLEAMFADWMARTDNRERFRPCPDCWLASIDDTNPGAHVLGCHSHPAALRLRAALTAVHAASTIIAGTATTTPAAHSPPAGAEVTAPSWPRQSRPGGVMRFEAELALETLWRGPTGGGYYQEIFSSLIEEWQRLVDRARDPCPSCDGVFPLAEMGEHLRVCERNPLYVRAAALEQELRSQLGDAAETLLMIALRRERYHAALKMLLQACDRYDAGLGWDGRHAYSKEDNERPWRWAVGSVERLLGIDRRPRRADPHPDVLAQALRRLIESAVGGADDGAGIETDHRLLLDAAASLDQMVGRVGRWTNCPACERPYIHRTLLAAHLSCCAWHPAVAEAHRAQAELAFLGRLPNARVARDAVPDLPFFDPIPAVRFIGAADERRDAALAAIVARSADGKRLPVPTYVARTVEEFIEEVQAFETAHAVGCPGCAKLMDLPAMSGHLMHCDEHPARRALVNFRATRASFAHCESPAVGDLQSDADRYAMALASLLRTCDSFWSSMGDDGPRSIISASSVPAWNAGRNAARRALGMNVGSDGSEGDRSPQVQANAARGTETPRPPQVWPAPSGLDQPSSGGGATRDGSRT